MLTRVETAKKRVEAYKVEREEQDVKVEAAKDANQALLDQEPNVKLEVDQAAKEVQESRQKLENFLVYSFEGFPAHLRRIKRRSKMQSNSVKTTSKIIKKRFVKNEDAKRMAMND